NGGRDEDIRRLLDLIQSSDMFALRAAGRAASTQDEGKGRWERSTAGRIAMSLIVHRLTPVRLFVARDEERMRTLVLVNDFFVTIHSFDKQVIAGAVLGAYGEHLSSCRPCSWMARAQLQVAVDSLSVWRPATE